MKSLLFCVFVLLTGFIGTVTAKNLVYISETKSVCYTVKEDRLVEGHWECDLDTDKCHCVTG